MYTQADQTLNAITVFHNNIYAVGDCVTILAILPCIRMLRKLHLMLGVENNLNKSAIPYLNCFGISLFLEGVKRHSGELYFPTDCR